MKKFGKMKTIGALSLAAVLGIGSVAAFAQTDNTTPDETKKIAGKERRGGGKRGGKFRRGKRGGAKMGGMMFRGINLTEDQKAQLKQIRENFRQTNQPLFEQLKAKQKELRAAKTDGSFNEAVAAQKMTEMASLRAKLMSESFKMRQESLAVLTPEQKAQLEAKRAEYKAKFAERKAKRGERKNMRKTAPADVETQVN
jgi:P pilus assembly/Cpx signaling pathway, periplasmic inhibitor/zinc-resistance associated protein